MFEIIGFFAFRFLLQGSYDRNGPAIMLVLIQMCEINFQMQLAAKF